MSWLAVGVGAALLSVSPMGPVFPIESAAVLGMAALSAAAASSLEPEQAARSAAASGSAAKNAGRMGSFLPLGRTCPGPVATLLNKRAEHVAGKQESALY